MDTNCLESLFMKYLLETPNFSKILNDYNTHIKCIDHIAFRFLNKNDIRFSEQFTLQPDTFNFEKYGANAMWYKCDNKFNRVFVSYYTKHIDENLIKHLTFEKYQEIVKENQYLAWIITNDHKINHVAIEVDDILNFTNQLILDGYHFNMMNGTPYSIGKNGKLIQTSLMAENIKFLFDGKEYMVPGSFVEFVQRIDNVEGFDNVNANNIVLSTNIE